MVALKASSAADRFNAGPRLTDSRIFFANRVSSPHSYHGNTSSDFEQVRESNPTVGCHLPPAEKRTRGDGDRELIHSREVSSEQL